MPQKYFADTWYWLALISEQDNGHEQAIAMSDKLADELIYTSQMVFDELLGACSQTRTQMLRPLAIGLIEGLQNDNLVTVIEQTPQQFSSALDRFKRYGDKVWSLTDCASMNIMSEHRIQTALTNDPHFQQASFIVRNS